MRRAESNPRPLETAHIVTCLCVDFIGSTQFGLHLTSEQLDRFNTALVGQIKPHLDKLGLAASLLKFAGDGWLVMSHEPSKVSALCCLAAVMASRFQEEMGQLTTIPQNSLPGLRLAICSGRDIPVHLPDGRSDWVGDSARRAVRSAQWCAANQVLIDQSVRDLSPSINRIPAFVHLFIGQYTSLLISALLKKLPELSCLTEGRHLAVP